MHLIPQIYPCINVQAPHVQGGPTSIVQLADWLQSPIAGPLILSAQSTQLSWEVVLDAMMRRMWGQANVADALLDQVQNTCTSAYVLSTPLRFSC